MPALEPRLKLRRVRARAFTVTFVATHRPLCGLTWSLLIHAALLLSLPYMLRFLPETTITLEADDPLQTKYEFLELPALPGSRGSGASRNDVSKDVSAAGKETASDRVSGSRAEALPEAVYAGPQEIVSNFRRATNNVQTIRRPDLVQPPKLKFPLRVQSMVLLAMPTAQPKLLAPAPQKQSSREEPAAKTEAVDKPII